MWRRNIYQVYHELRYQCPVDEKRIICLYTHTTSYLFRFTYQGGGDNHQYLDIYYTRIFS